MTKHNLSDLLAHIDPALLTYQEWVNVGMALKDEGYSAQDWDVWSSRDGARYHAGECEKKWAGFHGSPTPVTGGTVVQLARDQGWTPERDEGYELDWNSTIGAKDEHVVVDKNWIESRDVPEPDNWDPAAQLISILENAAFMGVPFPDKLKNALEEMKKKGSAEKGE